MAVPHIPVSFVPDCVNELWFSFDEAEHDKELAILEAEVIAEMERIDHKNRDLSPIGRAKNESFADEEDDDEEEDNDDDDEESESHEEDDDDEIDMDVEDQDSPTF